MSLNFWDFVVLSVGFFMMIVSFWRDVDFVIEKARRHRPLLRHLANARLIGLIIVLASAAFGVITANHMVAGPEAWMGNLPTMGLSLVGVMFGLELVFPSNQGL
jgi:hypothetical protein